MNTTPNGLIGPNIIVEHKWRCSGNIPQVGDTYEAVNNWDSRVQTDDLDEAIRLSEEAIDKWGPCAGLPWTRERAQGQAQIFTRDGVVIHVIP